jgi:hypothetical protein
MEMCILLHVLVNVKTRTKILKDKTWGPMSVNNQNCVTWNPRPKTANDESWNSM